ncbi:pyridoxal phosphate-dependent aminotransferase [bacterium]|nr:pyridoxal phosphate-dependent aminotransferase [bacterium]MCP5461799.1 pyridoxal phosphate-dependent aminotransferase [bacterium]
MQIAERVKKVSPSLTLAIDSKAKEMKKQGIDVVGFGAGEPDFDTPDYIKDAAKLALDKGNTKYTPVTGLPELKKAICKKLLTDNNLHYDIDHIAVNCGAKHSLYNYFQATINPGDEVLVPTPYWVSYPDQIILADGIPVFVHTTEESGYKITPEILEKHYTPKTRCLILNSPSNPSGVMYSEEELKNIANYCVSKNLPVISDEIYEHLNYDFPHLSIASFGDDIKALTSVVNGLSKSHSMTGWRIGYIATSTEIIKAINKIQGHSTSNPTTFAQIASIKALEGDLSFTKMMREEFKKRRDYVVNRLNTIKGITCISPGGAFYAFPDISGLGLGSMAFCEKLLDKLYVACVPGIAFGHDKNIRISYACSMATIEKGLDRIEKFAQSL